MRSLRGNSIRGKILQRSIAVAIVPLVILAIAAVLGVRQLGDSAAQRVDESREVLESESVLVASQEEAISVSREIDLVLFERIADVREWSRNRDVLEGASAAQSFARTEGLANVSIDELERRFFTTRNTGQAEVAQDFLLHELENNPLFSNASFTDSNGFNAAITDTSEDFVQSDEEWWQEAWTNGINIDDIKLDDATGEFSIEIAVRINDTRGAPLGVIHTTLDAKFVHEIANARSTDDIKFTIALADGRLIAETSSDDPSRLMSPGTFLNPGVLAALAETDGGGLVENEEVYGYTRTLNPSLFDPDGKGGFPGFDWVVISSQPADVAFAPLVGLEHLRDDITDSQSGLVRTILLVLFVALILAFVMGQLMANAITGPILKLTAAASASAETGLPGAVDKINEDGADIDSISVESVAVSTGDELEELADSFNSVQNAAVSLAAKQALSRRNTAEMFVNLGRRNQALLKRQLRFITDLEQDEADPDTLDSLFKLDHLATRMRRNAESLLVLAGDRSPRRWAAPVPIRDTVQAALAEVEGYERVEFASLPKGEIQGNIAADAAHILAELLENALNFSPPSSQVVVAGQDGADGYTLTISDEGLGMTSEDLESANERLDTYRELSEVPSQYLGLFVVSRLADRHDIKVELSAAPTGGLTARVLLPAKLTKLDKPEDSKNSERSSGDDRALNDDPEIQEAEAEALAMMAQAEEALARIEDAKKRLSSNAEAVTEAQAVTETEAEAEVEAEVETEKSEVEAQADRAKAKADRIKANAKADAKAAAAQESDADEQAAAMPSGSELPSRRKSRGQKSPEGQASTTEHGRRSDDNESTPAENSVAENSAAQDSAGEAVDVGGFTFARRGSTSPDSESAPEQRRSDDTTSSKSTSKGKADLEEYGFTRRESKKSAGSSGATGAKVANPRADEAEKPVTEEDAMVTAENNLNRWNRFQRGKEDALVADENDDAPSS